ncbi:hypothetical protein CVT24_006433 [Panaeolus cyanescens]|uniref:Mob1/phocein n=1 Tax=Panaeolus cyanescens TaxID=181874 RepID=A0A409VZ95_9AGAR|nr:hypothetical protein CVT24_006433 [Panaeolus cyanescens]
MTTVAGIQRPLRGSRISTFYPVKTLPSLSSLDSAFQLQEYISLLIRLNVHDVEAITSLPRSGSGFSDKEKEKTEGKEEEAEGDKESEKKGEVTVDEACWVYEHLRRLAQDLTHPLITTLQQECTRATCPEMKAGEWLYLCVAHGNDGAMEQCCAIDYILHTVDSATALLNSPRTFPSRLQIPQTSHRHFSSLARRLGRIFAHAYFHHREAFEQAEAESSLYARFLALTSKFDLVPSEFLVIPGGSTEDVGRDDARYNQGAQYPPPPQVRPGLAPKFSQQQQLGVGAGPGGDTPNSIRARSPNPPGLSESAYGRGGLGTVRMASGGIGEQPIPASMRTGSTSSPGPSFNPLAGMAVPPRTESPNASNVGSGGRARYGRNRTDTMILSGPTDDKAESGDGAEEEPVKTARPEPESSEKKSNDDVSKEEPSSSTTTEQSSSTSSTSESTADDTAADEAEEEEVASQFEISLTPEEEIASPFDTEIGGIPVILDADYEEIPEDKNETVSEDAEKKGEEAHKPPIEADVTEASPSPEPEASAPESKPDVVQATPVVKVTDYAAETPVETTLPAAEPPSKTPDATSEDSVAQSPPSEKGAVELAAAINADVPSTVEEKVEAVADASKDAEVPATEGKKDSDDSPSPASNTAPSDV